MTNREEGGGEKQTTTKKRKDKQMKERGVEKETIDVERERERGDTGKREIRDICEQQQKVDLGCSQ